MELFYDYMNLIKLFDLEKNMEWKMEWKLFAMDFLNHYQ